LSSETEKGNLFLFFSSLVEFDHFFSRLLSSQGLSWGLLFSSFFFVWGFALARRVHFRAVLVLILFFFVSVGSLLCVLTSFTLLAMLFVCLPACLLALLVCSIAALSAFLLQLLFSLTFFFLSIRLGE
jgi:hypothetical protein